MIRIREKSGNVEISGTTITILNDWMNITRSMAELLDRHYDGKGWQILAAMAKMVYDDPEAEERTTDERTREAVDMLEELGVI